ncbi:MAG: hypothetical protein AAGF82_21655 [Pseudomonadota bacterium]
MFGNTMMNAARCLRALRISLGALVVACLVLSGFSGDNRARAQSKPGLKNHVLGIGNCPPWNAQALEVCYNSLDRVVEALSPRLEAGPDNQHLLINEGASASALKLKATELANRLGAEDRLIIYANLPLGQLEGDQPDEENGFVLEFWADEKPYTAASAISDGIWITAPAFAAILHTIPAAEVILILDTNDSYAVNMHLLDKHTVDHKDRPEALVSSAGDGQSANYSADRTISLFAKHLALALRETDGSLHDVMSVAVRGTRQSAIPICAALKEHQGETGEPVADCQQVPQIHDPEALLAETLLRPLPGSEKIE